MSKSHGSHGSGLSAFNLTDAVEIKVTIRPDQELRAERAMEVNEDSASVRLIYFFETPELDLFDAGIALRARLVKGDADNSTVKFRSERIEMVAPEWYRSEGFKVEADWVGDRAVYSVSLTREQGRNEIQNVAKGDRAIDKLFSKDQERFFKEVYRGPIDFPQLRVMGPIRALRWKMKYPGFPHQLSVEEWRLPNGDDLVEVSIKVAPAEALEARTAFEELLVTLGLDPKGAQETKTRTALKYFAEVTKEPA
ncbi:hypothetical protein LZ016_00575 [Sphingomonas sp. SM33]|jgi:hypothetical protein|uniref:CYTH domain-containing protein n=1 Tax=Sphingomonas telluris TaxID=2907998 RepID=A0ABS9VI03_9SPHN|nr:hypothetical protein [Sphingomonas telluris]MCH8614602.1 hypothetical protein [Sphingomonas telluris]